MHRLISLSVILAIGVSASALAAPPSKLDPSAAMRFGIRVYARSDGVGATASRIHVRCTRWKKVGQTRPCTGTFRLTRHGHHADYTLTKHAATFLNTPNSVMYEVAAHTTHPLAGVPSSSGRFSGFYPK
jgi:hypothetical protein